MASNLLKEAERLWKKQKLLRTLQLEQIGQISKLIDEARDELQNMGATSGGKDDMEVDGSSDEDASVRAAQDAIGRLQQKIKATGASIGDTKDAQTALTKFAKLVDKTMPPDLGKAVKPIPMDASLVNHVIMDHLLRTGRLDVARTLASEAGEELNEENVKPFVEMIEVVEALRRHDLVPALEWACKEEARLEEVESDVGFNIVRMEYIQLVAHGKVLEAVNHARKSFERYTSTHLPHIQKLMGCLAFVGRLEKSPYACLFDEREWEKLADSVTKDCCRLMGLPRDLPLQVCIEAGIKALPGLLKFSTVMQGRIGDWGIKNALPIEIDLGPERKYHSVFVCPVSREQATADNPPMMMQCGHVLCEHSLNKMARGAAKFKCPYCPVEVSVQGSTRLYL